MTAALSSFIAGRGDARVLLIHGARRARLQRLLALAADAARDQPSLKLVDAAAIAGDVAAWREQVLARLPADVLVVVALPDAPDAGWHRGGWEHVVVELDLLRPPTFDRSAADVRAALRAYHDDGALDRSPLAAGAGAARAREALGAAAANAFGDHGYESVLRTVLVRGYLQPRTSHEDVAHALGMSRNGYFRALRAASDRVADHLAAHEPATHAAAASACSSSCRRARQSGSACVTLRSR